MLNKNFIKFFLIAIFIMGYSCSTTRKISNHLYTEIEGKDCFLFLKQNKEMLYIFYKVDKSYSIRGNLKQVSNNTFTTYNETIESILNDSLLNKVPMDKNLKIEVKKTLISDTLFFNTGHKYFFYNGNKFKIFKQ